MAHSAFASARTAETLAVWVATLGSLALLSYVLAYWTWAWLAPPPEPRSQVGNDTPRVESAYALFGGVRSAETAPTGVALTLLGIAAASGRKPGHSVLRIDGGKTVVVREGEQITPGLTLAEVHTDHIVIDHNGVREMLAWPTPASRNAPAMVKKP